MRAGVGELTLAGSACPVCWSTVKVVPVNETQAAAICAGETCAWFIFWSIEKTGDVKMIRESVNDPTVIEPADVLTAICTEGLAERLANLGSERSGIPHFKVTIAQYDDHLIIHQGSKMLVEVLVRNVLDGGEL